MELLPSEKCYPFQAILLHAIGLTAKENLSDIGGSGFSRIPAYWVASSAVSEQPRTLAEAMMEEKCCSSPHFNLQSLRVKNATPHNQTKHCHLLVHNEPGY